MSQITRRRFLGQSACAGFSLSGLLSTMGTLRLLNASVAAQTAPPPGDFKALVCLFLYGGNDANNVIVPRDTAGYGAYARDRGILAIPRTGLIPLTLSGGDGRDFGLHPSLSRLGGIFNAGRLGFVCNVGTLVAPITKAEFMSGGAAVPAYLFSHSDQQVQWQTSVLDTPRKIGWGGRLADLLQTLNAGSQISMNISLAGTNYFQIGEEVFQYHVSNDGSIGLNQYDAPWSPVVEQYAGARGILGQSYSHIFEQEYVNVMGRAVANDTLLKSVLATVPMYSEKFAASTNAEGELNDFAGQLRMILRLISAQSALGMRRQIYFAALGGFDTHDDQLNDHAGLLHVLDNAVADFHQATIDLGVANNTTLFTASDFNRTYNSNGKGSDHAWGSHHFVCGGAVQGGRLYGEMPVLETSGPSDTGDRGAWIPGVSTDEYSATLAKWFGVAPGDLANVVPNIGRFARPDLGFMG